MEYFKIDNVDYSKYVKSLSIDKQTTYNSQTNAAGNTVVDYINAKRSFTVGIIPLDAVTMASLQAAIDKFGVSITFRNPKTKELEENVACIIPANAIEYYTIQANKVLFKELTLKFIEL